MKVFLKIISILFSSFAYAQDLQESDKVLSLRSLLGVNQDTTSEQMTNMIDSLLDFDKYPQSTAASPKSSESATSNYECRCSGKPNQVAWCTQAILCCCGVGGPRCAGWLGCN